jgi:acid phosphatase
MLPYRLLSLESSHNTDKTEEVRRLGMGRLLSDMTRKMQARVSSLPNKVSDQADLRILVHSTHDAALAGVCATFDVFDEK